MRNEDGSYLSCRRALLAFVVTILTIACQTSMAPSSRSSPSTESGYGVVVGGIDPCFGFPPPTPPPYQAGTVDVLRGSDKVASEEVPDGGTYRFTLQAGNYVLASRDVARGPASRIGISVVAGQMLPADIPSPCI